jgi:hypothetical protein
MRSLHDPIILTTLLHLGVLYHDTHIYYKYMVTISTILSVLWHLENEKSNYLFYLDYSGAVLWFFADIYYTNANTTVIFLNLFSFTANTICDRLSNYSKYHSFWHILNVIKSLAVVQFIPPSAYRPRLTK